MAIVVTNADQRVAVTSTNTATISSYDTSVLRVDRVLVVCVTVENSSTAPTVDDVTFNSVSLTLADQDIGVVSGNDVRSEIWYMASPSGTADIVATLSASADSIGVKAMMLDGAVAQAPEATNSATDTSSPVGPDSITTVTDGAFIISCLASSITGAVAATETDQSIIGTTFAAGSHTQASSGRQGGDAGSHTMGYTQTSLVNVAHVLTAWEDAGAWISNFVSALTEGNEDFTVVENAAQVSTVTTPLPSADWGRVFQFSGNASPGALTFNRWVPPNSEPTANHLICGFYIRFTDLSPGTAYPFFGIVDDAGEGLNTGIVHTSLQLETDGDCSLLDQNESNVTSTTTSPFTVDTWHRIEVRHIPAGFNGECQVWVDGTDIFGGNQTYIGANALPDIDALAVGGPHASGDGNVFFAGAYVMIHSTAASDRLDSDFEVVGPYQDTAISGTTPDNGNTLDAGDWANVNEIPFSDTAALASYTGNPDLGGIHYDGGTRSGPSGDSRVDGDSNIKAWRGIFRGQRGNGSSAGGDHRFYVGDDGGTWTSGFDSMALVLSGSDVNYYFCTDVSTNMPSSSDNFSLGFGTSIARDIRCREMAAFVLHVPAAAAVTVPELTTATRIPT
jgi:hypothetical protein